MNRAVLDSQTARHRESDTFHPDFLGEMCRRIGLQRYPDVRQFVVQHLFPDTVRLLRLLHDYLPIDTVIGISYSGCPEAIRELRDMGIRVLTPGHEDLAPTISRELENCVDRCRASRHRLVIHEVGGLAVRALHEPEYFGGRTVIGALEITKQGVWMAERLPSLRVPQMNVAQTRLKQIEGKLVGEAVVASLDTILRELGYATVGRDALVCGYGWVGKGVAQSLRQRGMCVSVRDTDTVSLVEAAVDGHRPCRQAAPLPGLMGQPAIAIGASGHCSIDSRVLPWLPDRCFLVSGASRNHEIDLDWLHRAASRSRFLHEHVREFGLEDGRRLYLVNEGYPVNFTGASVPDEIVEFLFAELIQLIPRLLDDTPAPGIHTLSPAEEVLPASIWLDLR